MSSPGRQPTRRLKARWPEASLHGTRTHVPFRDEGAAQRSEIQRDAGELLAGLTTRTLRISAPSFEDAFVWYATGADTATSRRRSE